MMIIITIITAAAVKVSEITSSNEYRPQQTLMVHRLCIVVQSADEW